MLLVKIVDFFKRKTDLNKKSNVYNNGVDNNYPEIVERLINNSVTAKRGASIIQSMILGKGFDNHNDFIINETKNLSLFQFLNDCSNSFSRQNGVFIHCNYWANGQIKDMNVLPYGDCRVGLKDDNDYFGKIVVKDWENLKDKPQIFNVYNSGKKVIQSQIISKGLNKYNGQILFINPSSFIYPLSKVDSVLKDADSEYQVSIFKNVSLRKGFFGKQIVITQPFTDGNVDKDTKKWREGDTERENFRKNMSDFLGSENVDGFMHLEQELVDDDIDKSIKFIDVKSNINDKLFAHTESSINENISVAFNTPQPLIRPSKGALFAQSASAIREMKLFVQDETMFERRILEITINRLLKNFKGYDGTELKIVKLIQKADVNNKK